MVKLKQPIPKKKIPPPGGSGPSKLPPPKSLDTKAGKAPSVGGGIASPTPAPTPGPKRPPDVAQRVIDKGRDVGTDRALTISLAEKRAKKALLASPVGEGLRWLVDAEAKRVLKLMVDIPGILDTLLGSGMSPREVFEFLLADGIGLSDEDLNEVLRHGRRLLSGPPSFLGLPVGRRDFAQSDDADVYVRTTEDMTVYANHDCALPMIAGHEAEGCGGLGETTRLPAGTELQVLARSPFNPLLVLVTDGEEAYWMYAPSGVSLERGNVQSIPTDRDLAPLPEENPWEKGVVYAQSTTYPLSSVDPEQTRIMQFARRDEALYSGLPDSRHTGMDLFARPGTDVVAVADGDVVAVYIPSGSALPRSPLSPYQGAAAGEGDFAEYDPKQAPAGESAGVTVARGLLGDNRVGAYVAVRSGNVLIIYAHLDPSTVQVGEYVHQGQIIGEVVNDPLPNNSHLHLEVRGYGFNDPVLGENDEFTSASSTPRIALNPARLFRPEYAEEMLNPGLTYPGNPNVDCDAWDTRIAAIDLGARSIHYNAPIDPDFSPDFSSVWPDSIFRRGE